MNLSLRPFLALLIASCNAGQGATTDAAVDVARVDRGAPASGCSVANCAPYACDPDVDRCRSTCERAEHCMVGFVCESMGCVGTGCTAATAREQCGHYTCVSGECAHTCETSGCADGYYCRGDTHRCVPRCTTREDSACGGYVCDLGVRECEPYCLDGEVECASGYTCNSAGACVLAAR